MLSQSCNGNQADLRLGHQREALLTGWMRLRWTPWRQRAQAPMVRAAAHSILWLRWGKRSGRQNMLFVVLLFLMTGHGAPPQEAFQPLAQLCQSDPEGRMGHAECSSLLNRRLGPRPEEFPGKDIWRPCVPLVLV